ncbi:helix-turn-helix domain-containing protein [Microlunatus kandeliicorticis]|nr:helix-turn-helix domain-containing protein [Microlunatus kandeliicorticis]
MDADLAATARAETALPLAQRPQILASWERCERRGLPPAGLEVPHTADFDDDTSLAHAALPVLRVLQASLPDEPLSIMLSDRDGLVAIRLCHDRDILRALDAVSLAPGSTYSEDAVGTNGFGIALTDDRPSLVAGVEHYSADLAGFTCAGSPVHDPVTGTVAGALSLTTWSERRPDLLMALAAQTAMNIEAQLTRVASSTAEQKDDFLEAITERRGPRLSALERLEREAIVEALSRCGGPAEAAAELGISRATVYRRIRRYRIRVGLHPVSD